MVAAVAPGPGPWPLGARFDEGRLVVSGRAVSDLAAAFGTPLVVVDEDHVRARARGFRDAFPRALWAVKSFPAGALIRVAVDEGLGLLVSTGGELDACLRAGAPADRVVFHGTNKLDAELERAVGTRVGLLIVDNMEELERLDGVVRAAGAGPQAILLRIVPGLEAGTHEYVRTGTVDTKFGIPLADRMALSAVERALSLPGLRLEGIHMHIGSQVSDAAVYLGALEVAISFLEDARDAHGFGARILDMGGGLGVRYRDEPPLEPAALALAVTGLLGRECAARGLGVPELIAEPGRSITSGAAVTLYSVGTVKRIPGRTYVNIDGGMSDNIRPALYGSKYTIALASRPSASPPDEVVVVGRHCETGDVLGRVTLPSDVRRGDLLAVASTGAYEYAMSSNYNKVPRPAVVMVREGAEPKLILRRETEDDLARLEVG
jgi:diaminopimelate decarboxylase